MSDWEIVQLGADRADLARFNAEVARGIIHTDEWRAKMAEVQAQFDAERRQRLIADGYEQVNDGNWWIGPCAPASSRPWWKRWLRG